MQWELKLAVFNNPNTITAVILLSFAVCPQICALSKLEILRALAVQ